MGHYALIGEDGVVIRVNCQDDGPEGDTLREERGGNWVQTSYNTFAGKHRLGGTPLRKNYAGIGYTYDSVRDAFIPPQPYLSWILNEETCQWDSPIPYPIDGSSYRWDEESLTWKE